MAVRQVPYASFPAARSGGASIPRVVIDTARAFGRDFAVVLGVVGVYFVLRGLAPDRLDFSVHVTEHLVAFEQSLHLFWEPKVQEASIQWYAVKEFANFVYAYMHFPVLIVVGAGVWFRDRNAFRFMRNVMFISMVIGLLFYYLVPAAPPRLMAAHGHELGFVDTVFGTETNVSYAQPSLILNEYAAIPSFHFGWIAMASAAIWVNTRNIGLRAAAVTLTLVMTWAIVASANHLFIDMALGGLVIGISWWLASRIERRRNGGQTNEPIGMRQRARSEYRAAA